MVASAPKAAKVRRVRELTIVMKALSSLKLTVALFAYGIFVVLVGTLAQEEMDIWQVVPLYFRSVVMWVDVNLFFPSAFFPQMPHLNVPLIPMPGGMVVGVLMLLNLAAAHGWRFQMQVKGARLLWGMAALATAALVTTLVIVSGNIGTGIQARPLLSPQQIWFVFCALLVVGWLGSTYGVTRFAWKELAGPPTPKANRSFGLRLLALVVAGYAAWTALVIGLVSGLLAPPTESMRILWQLLQAEAAGLALLGACYILFAKRAGIVLLHGGVVLMMVSELVVARYAIEWQMFLSEGQALNYVRDTRTIELAFINKGSDGETVVAVPRRLLEKNYAENDRLAKAGKPLAPIRDAAGTHELLPADVTVLKYYRNHDVRPPKADEKPLATAGVGREVTAVEARPVTGTDTDRGNDIAAAYIKLTEKKTGRDLGTYLFSQLAEDNVGRAPEEFQQSVEAGGKKYDVLIRYERQYKPYTVKLEDVRKDDYLGSDTPKNYSSDVQLIDPETGMSSKIHIKMNDPLRYRGDTFYQSGYHPPDPRSGLRAESTTLAVVNNVGWMIPYTACMIVVTGLIFQFSVSLKRFLNRRAEEESRMPLAPRHYQLLAMAIAAIVAVGYIGSKLSPPSREKQRFNTVEFGKLPVVSSGRVKPIDTLARNSLRAISNYETLRIKRGDETVKLSAVEWLLDVVTQKEGALDYPVIKVDHPDLIRFFNLQPASKSLYSVRQLADKVPELTEMARAAFQKKESAPETLTTLDRKALELFDRIKVYDTLVEGFSPPRIPPVPSAEERQQDPEEAQHKALAFQQWMIEFPSAIRARQLALLIPIRPEKDDPAQEHWLPYPLAFWEALRSQATKQDASPLTQQFAEMLGAYASDRPTDFQRALTQY
ncbi:MAG TPA: cytochrome c biogenesis protein ResB, partial [Pirellulaceae bacterium]|nr:cytochrome c biogenesis protein ResB [Pirellulaceae bacterium]